MKFLALTAAVLTVVVPAAAAEKPNFILINVDDLGYADIGPYGGKNPTPHLDRLAAEGRKLASHYAAPVCSPSRAALMTGCYPKRVLPTPHVLFPAGAVGLNPDETTVAEVLKGAGYATACIGKWHLGDQPPFLPTRQGFDVYFGLPYSNDMGPIEDGAKNNPGQAVRAPRGGSATPNDEAGIRSNQPPLPLVDGERVVERVRAAEQTTLTDRYTNRAVEFIREHRDVPFFLYFPHTAVHFPHYPADEFRGKSPGGTLVGDWVCEVDASVGRVMNALHELGLDERTLVLFTSDNGGPLVFDANNGPLRGGKGSTLEGGVRVCTIARWPGRIPAGTATDAMTSMMDVLPTFAAIAGAQVPADRKRDGVDVSGVLFDTAGDRPPREIFYFYKGLDLEAVRSGPWKLHLAKGELYNLQDDIGESKNVAAAHADVVSELTALADAMDSDLGKSGAGPGVRPLGRVVNPQPLIAP